MMLILLPLLKVASIELILALNSEQYIQISLRRITELAAGRNPYQAAQNKARHKYNSK